MKRLIDKLIAALVLLPPLYMLLRFVRWSLSQEQPHSDEDSLS
jgi:hypothetical protein